MKKRTIPPVFLFLVILPMMCLTVACSSDEKDTTPTGTGGTGGTNISPEEYFGLIQGRTISAGYANYIRDSLRQFIANDTVDAWTFSPVVGTPVAYHGTLAFPISGAPIKRHYSTPDYTFTLYFSADSTGLYWHGGVYCSVDLPLSQPARVAPYPLSDGATWQTIGHAETDIDQCIRSVADTLNATCTRLGSASVRGTVYPDVYLVRIPFVNVPGHIGTRYYEVWMAPGYGPIRGASFWPGDTTYAAYTRPKEGFEFISYSN